jgi:hypothetical protein
MQMAIRSSSGKRKPLLLVIFFAVLIIDASPQQTTYSNTPNKELKIRAFGLVKDVRGLVYSYRKRDGELLSLFDQKNRSGIRADERKGAREQWIRESDAVHDSFMREYKEKYWADAILLRNEMYRRLPKKLQQPEATILYQHPTNILGVEIVADNLELLAKSLADNKP